MLIPEPKPSSEANRTYRSFWLQHAIGVLGLVLASVLTTDAGDILRGGAAPNAPRDASSSAAATAAAAAQARANAQDALARNAQALNAVKNLQAAARAAAAAKGADNLGADPNHPGAQLPNVPNGLVPGGLQIAGAPIGAGAPTQSGNRVNVKQTSQQAILNWTSFNIGKNTVLNFDQSAGGANVGKWIAFNRISDPSGSPSQILGSIQAQGQVYVINQNGIIFGGTSQVNVHALVASSLPINGNLIDRGLLNNPDAQFLFSALALPAGSKGPTPAFIPPSGKIGDVTVQPGAILTAPTTAEHVGGRIALIGPNVTNSGSISTPDGQTILAAGLQVGLDSHKSSDPSLRGLDVYVGAISNPNAASPNQPFAGSAGTATNNGLIDAPRANVTITGKSVNQLGVINSSTSVSLNGRIDLIASYGALSNSSYNPVTSPTFPPFLYTNTGAVTIGPGSVVQILPEWASTDRVIGTQLSLRSQINIQGKTVYLAPQSSILAPNGIVNVNAGKWDLVQNGAIAISTFVNSAGQIYLDQNASINVAGSTDVAAELSEYIFSVTLRGAEFADSPLQRTSIFRPGDGTNPPIVVDLRKTGVYNGRTWYGTPLADLSGYLGLIQRDVGELTVAGGAVNLSAGSSVVVQPGAKIDVSGGFTNFGGGTVKTTRVLYANHLMEIADATPNRLYQGIFTGIFTESHPRWGVTRDYEVPWMTGAHYEQPYTSGADGGQLSLFAPSMAIDGDLYGNTVAGPRQRSSLPTSSSLSITFQTQEQASPYAKFSSAPPAVSFEDRKQTVAGPFGLDAFDDPLPLTAERIANVFLSPSLLDERGFGIFSLENSDGNVLVPKKTVLNAGPLGSITINGANFDLRGSIIAPGGIVTLTAFNLSPRTAASLRAGGSSSQTPPPEPNRGNFTLGQSATITTAGLIVDDRFSSPTPGSLPLITKGGTIAITSYNVDLLNGSLIDVSGGVVVSPTGKIAYGDAGSISIKAGQDPNILSLVGGHLKLGGTLLGYSGAKGGALTLQAPVIQIGGSSPSPNALLLQPDFFSEGGFASFSLTGIGEATGNGDEVIPGVSIAPGTVIEPVVKNYLAIPHMWGQDSVVLVPVLGPEGLRTPASLSFTAAGVTNEFTGLLTVRGDLVVGQGSRIQTDALGSVSLKGNTVAVFGSIFAPGGSINVTGSSNSTSTFPNRSEAQTEALVTVYLASSSELSTAGKVLLLPDRWGHRTGFVLPGGTISVSGNILAEAGAKLDASGTSGILDYAPVYLGLGVPGNAPLLGSTLVPVTSGVTSPLYSAYALPLRVDSNGGAISLRGGQELFTSATLLAKAGGETALGGSLSISSGRFYPLSAQPQDRRPTNITLRVTQSDSGFAPGTGGIGLPVTDSAGGVLTGQGQFAVNDFLRGGFDSLRLGGTIEFSGPVNITARNTIAVALPSSSDALDGGIIYADSSVRLVAPYVALGKPFTPPIQAIEQQNYTPYRDGLGSRYLFAPTYGTGSLTVIASLIDIGNLSLQNIGEASLVANGGDIRGQGTFDIAGRLHLQAGQIYPVTASPFTIAAYDYIQGAVTNPGTVTIVGSGIVQLPLSAGGTLSVYGSVINQGGTLRAPIGTINLGWDGVGTAPIDVITGQNVPVSQQITLASGSVTSVSAIDPITGKGVIIPYGLNPFGTAWIDPAGLDITAGGAPAKTINISSQNLTTQAGSTIDIRGGGDLYAYQWLQGNGGSKDVLTSSSSFAVIPGYRADFMPFAPFSTSSTGSANLNGDSGYVNSGLSVGDRVYLDRANGLAGGTYTLLPARYALLPGAFLVTPQSGAPIGTFNLPDGSVLVNGYRYNDLNSSRNAPSIYARFEVLSSEGVRQRSEFKDYFANTFLKASAIKLDQKVPRLPIDAGYLLLSATQGMVVQGQVNAKGASGGRGGLVDISSPLDIFITGPGGGGTPGTLTLDASLLNSFGADSILIGGARSFGTNGTTVNVRTNNLTVNNAGVPLSGPEIILVANRNLTLAPGASIQQSGTLADAADILLLGNASIPGSGDGVLLRVNSDPTSQIVRSGVTSSTVPNMNIGPGTIISGVSLTLDSTALTTLDPTAILDGQAIFLNTGRFSIRLPGSPPPLQPNPGLVLDGNALLTLQSAQSLSLLSYSTIDIYGTGNFSTQGSLALHAAEIRGFNTGGTVIFNAPTILLDNSPGRPAPGTVQPASGFLEFNAKTVTIGTGRVGVDQFVNVTINSPNGVLLQGEGGLIVQNALTVNTSLLTASKSANQSLVAGGALNFGTSPGATPTVVGGLGATVNLSGSIINAGTDIILTSGALTLMATGNIAVTGNLDASGSARTFFDQVRYTDGGQITLRTTSGDVNVGVGGRLNVAAQSGGGNAGNIVVGTPAGSFNLAGTMAGSGGIGGNNGTFTLDVGVLPNYATLNNTLNAAQFTQSRNIRVRGGDVTVTGTTNSRVFNLSTDQGSINVDGTINASGATGGIINLVAWKDVVLRNNSLLDVSAQNFNSAGKGGAISLEAGSSVNNSGVYAFGTGAVLDIQSGSTLKLSVANNLPGSAALGQFTGTLHLRAPQNVAGNDLALNPILGTITDASVIAIEGYRVFNPTGGSIDSVTAAISSNGTTFTNNTGNISTPGTIIYRVLANNGVMPNNVGLAPVVRVLPGAEIVNNNTSIAPLAIRLNTSGTSNITVASGVNITFPIGTSGNQIRSSASGIITLPGGGTTPLVANSPVSLVAGSSVTLSSNGTVTFASGGGGPISINLPANASYTTSGAATIVPTATTTDTIQLAATGSSITLPVNTSIAFPNGTLGNNIIRSTRAGTITLATGSTLALVANVNTTLAPGSSVRLAGAGTGTISFFSGTTGGAIPINLSSVASYTTTGAINISTSRGDLTLGTATSFATSDWNLSTYRFGPNLVPGILTMRAAGDLVLNNAINDGFVTSAYNSALLTSNSALPANLQSWSYRLTAGSDLSAADFHQVRPIETLDLTSPFKGSLQLGKNGASNTATVSGANATTASAVNAGTGRFQVIRTGTGDIDISVGRNVQLLNQFASIYTVGSQLTDSTMGGTFDLPVPNMQGQNVGNLGINQQSPRYPAQYTLAGGNVTVAAGVDLLRLTRDVSGNLIADSSRELPVNWLYRRGYVDPVTGLFGRSRYGEVASTSWWVDFSNFFEGVGALGGGNVTLIAGRDVTNVDGLVPTNARMTGTSGGVAIAPNAVNLVELGGGDLTVQAGRNIDGGVYYVERGNGSLTAGGNITTNSTRTPSLGILRNPVDILTPETWLPTTLFLGKGGYNVSARGSALLGPVVNPFLLPQGYSNTYWYKTYFSTYSPTSFVNVSSLGGDVTLRESVTLPAPGGAGVSTPTLQAFMQRQNLLVTSGPSLSASSLQPWLRLAEDSLIPFSSVYTLSPASLKTTAFSGDINLVGNINLSPSSTGTADLIAAGAFNALQINGTSTINSATVKVWTSGSINLSDANPLDIPGLTSPFAYQTLVGVSAAARSSTLSSLGTNFLSNINNLLAETGSTTGNAATVQTKQALHGTSLLHEADAEPLRIYAASGDISGLTLYSGKASRIISGHDLSDIGLYLQNLSVDDVSIVSAGRDIVAYNANTPSRVAARSSGNVLSLSDAVRSGDIQINGPGTLEVFAGRNLDLGSGLSNSDGTGAGLTSIGNGRNPNLPFEGASIIAGAGLGSSNLDFTNFISQFVNGPDGARYFTELAEQRSASGLTSSTGGSSLSQSTFASLSQEEQNRIALEIFYIVLRDAGRDHNIAGSAGFGTYTAGTAAIAALFPGTYSGDITTQSRDIRTKSGGDINLFAPGGSLTLQTANTGSSLAPPGIITERGGNISIFTDQNVDLGISRIFTLRGGNEIIWSTNGNIAAGSSSKTVQSAPPTRVLIDPQSADVQVDLAGLATGGGIGVLATVAGVPPGNVDLIAPTGVVDAGDAGIRATGNLNIAATAVLNASNIAISGSSSGTPVAPTVTAPNIGGLTSASNTAGAGSNTAGELTKKSQAQTTAAPEETPSIIIVEVLGYGGTVDDEDEELKKRKRAL